jgi:hypothetical protein
MGIASGGNITASYTLDGVSKTLSIPAGTLDSLPMVQLYHADCDPGLHTLFINLTAIEAPRALGIDLIAYNASFNNITPDPTGAAASNPSTTHKSNMRAKVGVVFGALAGVAVLVSLSVLLWRKYAVRRARRQKFQLPEVGESHPFFLFLGRYPENVSSTIWCDQTRIVKVVVSL